MPKQVKETFGAMLKQALADAGFRDEAELARLEARAPARRRARDGGDPPSKTSPVAKRVKMKSGAAPDRSLQKRIALLVNSGPLSQTTALGCAAALPSSSRKSASRAPVIEVATSWPTHSLEKSTTTFRMRKRWPLASWPYMKPAGQRPFGRVGMASGTRGRHSLLRRLVRTCRPSREQARRLRLRSATKPSRLSMRGSVR